MGSESAHISALWDRPSELVRVHEDFDLCLGIALAKDREARFRSATSFSAALYDASRGELDATGIGATAARDAFPGMVRKVNGRRSA